MLYRAHLPSLTSLTVLTLLLGGCPDDTTTTVSASESSSGSTQATTESPTPDATSTGTPTTGPEPTTDPSTSTGPATVTDTSTSTGPEPSTGSSSGTDTSTGTTAETDPGTSSSSTGDTETTAGVECTPGELNCDCLDDTCVGQTQCIQDKCLPVGDGSCVDFEFDFECDEPDLCAVGSDPFDCCPSFGDGICEEFGMGGECPPYSDYLDCGYCPFENNGICEAPEFCPAGTDEVDCCATPQNGTCEEVGGGGMCAEGSDFFDCGYCIYEGDGECDVPQYCPDGTDEVDCCATVQNGTCEEMQFGGECENGSDSYDCGVCQFEEDGACDVPFFCPPGSDEVDCCATLENGVCEEMQFGGMCQDGSDPYDCGVCPFEDDGVCDVPEFCPPGSDVNDCA